MPMITAYRLRSRYLLEPRPDATPVVVVLSEGVSLQRRPDQNPLLVRVGQPHGAPLGDALKMGWCRVVG